MPPGYGSCGARIGTELTAASRPFEARESRTGRGRIDALLGRPSAKGSLILTPSLNACNCALGNNDRNSYWSAAYAAILDVLLLLNGAVDNNLNLLPAVWALNKCGLEILHEAPNVEFRGAPLNLD